MKYVVIIALVVLVAGCADKPPERQPEVGARGDVSVTRSPEQGRVALGEVITDAADKTKFTMEVTLPDSAGDTKRQEQ